MCECVFSNITLCGSAKDDEGGEDACQRTRAEVRGPVTGSPAFAVQEADISRYSVAGTLRGARCFNSSSPTRRAVANGAACCVNTHPSLHKIGDCACMQKIL